MYKPYLSNDYLLSPLNLGDFVPSRIKPFSRVGEGLPLAAFKHACH